MKSPSHGPGEPELQCRCYDLMFDGVKPCERCPAMACLETGERQVAELGWPDGRDVRIHSVPFHDEEGDIQGIVQTVLDVTESRRMQRELLESEERLSLAMENGHLAAADLDVGSGGLTLDSRWARMLACEVEALPSSIEALMEWVHVDDRARVRRELARCVNSAGARLSVEQRMLGADGAVRWVLTSGAAVKRDESGRAERVVWVCHDMTSRREAEAELMRRKQEMAYMSRVTTMGELSISLAHELNQPLGAMMANAHAARRLLEREVPDLDEAKAALSDIVADNLRAAEVIKRLRALLLRGEVDRKSLSMNVLIDDVMGLMHGEFVLRNLTVSTQLAEALPSVMGDRVQLQQVLVMGWIQMISSIMIHYLM